MNSVKQWKNMLKLKIKYSNLRVNNETIGVKFIIYDDFNVILINCCDLMKINFISFIVSQSELST